MDLSTDDFLRSAPDARLKVPAYAVIAECLKQQGSGRRRTVLQRFVGVTPLVPEAEPWFKGALGELQVARILDGLGPDWTVLHAVPVGTRGSDIDHVVIGPPGVFTINSKRHAGAKVWAGGATVMINGHRTPYIRKSRSEAGGAERILSAAVGYPVLVRPIIALADAKSVTVKSSTDVTVLSAARLASFLKRQPARLPLAQRDALSTVASRCATWSSTPAPDVDLTRWARLQRDIEKARRRKRSWLGSTVLAGVAVIIAGPIVLLNGILPLIFR